MAVVVRYPVFHGVVNPASLDVRLGNNIMVEVPEDRKLHLLELTDYTEDEPYELTPGEFCLAETLEPFAIPERISARLSSSSRAREGISMLSQGGSTQAGLAAS